MEKAPVEACWSFSKISCSSFGRRGGEGPGVQEDWRAGPVVKGRRERKKPGRMVRGALLRACMVGVVVVCFVSCEGVGWLCLNVCTRMCVHECVYPNVSTIFMSFYVRVAPEIKPSDYDIKHDR